MKKILTCFLAMMLCTTLACTCFVGTNAVQVDANASAVAALNVGDYILLGKYNDEPIVWQYVADDENGMLMLSDKILCRKSFDVGSMELSNGSHVRPERISGSNYWGDSNIRSWLNSTAPAGEVDWLCGIPPTRENLAPYAYNLHGYEGYDGEKGFLADGNFKQSERNVMKEVTQKSLLDQTDVELAVGGTKEAWGRGRFEINIQNFLETQYDEICFEYVTDKVFLLDIEQFSKITSKDLGPVRYWLRTPFGRDYQYSGRDTYYSGSRVFTSGNDRGYGDEYISAESTYLNYGIRPAFYLNEANAVILSGSGTAEDPYVMDGMEEGASPEQPEEEIGVFINGTRLEFDQPPIMDGDRVLVPMRGIFEYLGAAVSWEEATQTVTAVKDDVTILLQIGSNTLIKNEETILLDVPAQLVGERTLVPIRAVAESFGATVEWNEDELRVDITV